jgi:hypothetical protein
VTVAIFDGVLPTRSVLFGGEVSPIRRTQSANYLTGHCTEKSWRKLSQFMKEFNFTIEPIFEPVCMETPLDRARLIIIKVLE